MFSSKKLGMSRLGAAGAAFLMVALLFLSFPGAATAASLPPHRFWGTAYMNNVVVDDGTEVSVWSTGGTEYASTATFSLDTNGDQVVEHGLYLIDVTGTTDGEQLVFKVAAVTAKTYDKYGVEILTVIFHPGGSGDNTYHDAVDLKAETPPNSLIFSTPSRSIDAGQPSMVMTVQHLDETGTLAPVATDTTLNLGSSSTPGSFYFSEAASPWVNVTSVIMHAGSMTASFYYKDTKAGTPTVTVAKAGWLSATQQETINPLPAVQLTVTGMTDPVTAGNASSATVTAKDPYGNVATGYRGTIHFTSSDAQATLPVNYTFQAGDNGVKTFSGGVIMKTVGEQSVTVTDTVTPSITGQQTAITVTPAVAFRLEVTGSASMNAGGQNELTIRAKDQYGNLVTSFSGSRSLTFSGPGNAPSGQQPTVEGKTIGTTTTVSFASGVSNANAATLVAYKAETTTVNVSDSSGLNSNGGYGLALTVNALAASRLEVAGSATMTAGGTNELTVTAKDQYGNVATSYSGSKNLTFSGPGVAPSGQQPTVEAVVIGSPTTVSFTNGVSNANAATLIAYKVETTTVDVNDGSINSFANAAYDLDLTVTPAAAHLEVSAAGSSSATMTAGTSKELTITAKDQYGNIITSYSGAKSLTFSGPGVAPGGQQPTVEGIVVGNPRSVTFTGGVSATNGATLITYRAEITTVDVTDGTLNSFGDPAYDLDLTVNAAAASHLEVTGSATMIAGGTNELTITAKDQYGNVATGYSGAKSLTFSGPATAPGGQKPTVEGAIVGNATPVSFTGGVSNAGAASLVAYKVETTTVDVSDGSINSSASPAYDLDLTVTAATASQLVVSGITDPVGAGTASGVTVTVKDAYGNIAANYTGTIHFTSSDAQATLPGNYAFQAGDGGVKTFSGGVIMKTVGEQSVTATDTVSGITGQQTAITVNPAAASHLEVTGSAGMTAGGQNELIIKAKDQYGNVATGYSGTKNLTFSGPGTAPGGQQPTVEGTVVGNPRSVTFTGGVSATNGATLITYRAEITTVDVTDGTLNSFGDPAYDLDLTVNAAAASHLEVTGSATMIAGGTNELTITAKDQYGNVATGYSGAKSLTFSGPATAPGGQKPTVEGAIVGNATLVSFTGGVSNAGAASLVAYKVETTTVDVSDGSINSFADPAYDLDLTVTPAAASELMVSGITDPVGAGTASGVTVTVKDAYGNIAANYTGTIHFTSSDAQAALPANYTFQAGDNGVKTFSGGVTMKTAGEQWVKATDTVSAIFGQQTAITVTPAAASRIEVTGSATMAAGDTNELTVTAKDQYGNIVTSYSGVKNLTFSGPGNASDGMHPTVEGINIGNVTLVTFTSGVSNTKAATLIAYKAEATTVNVSDSSGLNSGGGYGLTLTVNAGAGSRLEVTGITDPVVAGTASSVTVTARDAYGNIAAGYTGTIHLTSSDAQATLPANYAFQASDNGMKTFIGGVTMKTAGEQWVKATDTVTATITGEQTAITIAPAVAFRLEVTGNATMSAGGNNELTLTAKDQYGNLATGYNGAKNLTFSGPGIASQGQQPTVEGVDIGNPTAVNFANGVSDANAATLTAYKAETTVVNVSDGSINSSGYGLSLTVDATAISRLAFATPPRSIAIGTASAVITVQTQDTYGNPSNVAADAVLNISSTSATGLFSQNAMPWVNTNSVTIPSGQNSADFYYKDTSIGTPLITVAETPSHGWTDASQQQAITLVVVEGEIDLQGRPPKGDESWVTDLTVTFLQSGVAVSTQNVTTDNQGRFTVAISTGTYDIRVKSARTLSNLITGQVIIPGTNLIYFGTLREGDANDDNVITGADYSYLYTYFGATLAPGLDYCDFNRDGVVNGLDYALLWMNFGQMGDI